MSKSADDVRVSDSIKSDGFVLEIRDECSLEVDIGLALQIKIQGLDDDCARRTFGCGVVVSDVDLGNGNPLADFRAACTVQISGIGEARVNVSDEPAVVTNEIGVRVLDSLLQKLKEQLVNE